MTIGSPEARPDGQTPAASTPAGVTRFDDLDFEGFKRLARDPTLSLHEKIGFPDSYRAGRAPAILADISGKLTNLALPGKRILDIGPGCGELAVALVEHCQHHDQHLSLIDSAEMLVHLPGDRVVTKIAARFPAECRDEIGRLRSTFDAILVYSVLHYVVGHACIYDFFDTSLSLLAPGGQLLIGDIPNLSQRNRFFSSAAGVRFHQEFMGTNDKPTVTTNTLRAGQIDDAIVLSLLQRARGFGFHGYVVPQAADLPMANRREDILIVRP